ncbi:aldo/keto reductase [Nocardia transvalensis]|uniref:aldo/keto reductase n=1 Tax=Nocardia transvalensis TaxID=37333 RepID=UPI0018930C20|nr:aldo/keto reductase [Nocardia transvalensis]MBF6331082.1 aldo/keto reductase [Nocardia transvalensis]
MVTPVAASAAASGVISLGDSTVHRLGFGAMQLVGPYAWGEPPSREEAVRVLRRAVELGVNLIDTADSYGPHISEELIRIALHPYPDGLVIATKGGMIRPGPLAAGVIGRPDYLRQQVELSLRRLGLERIELYQLHRIDPTVPVEESVQALAEMQSEGKIGSIGLSEVSVDDIEVARTVADIASVQNVYNLVDRRHEAVLEYCEREGIAFLPWTPIATGELARPGGILDQLARAYEATPAQLALSWLLHRSPTILPIPGTRSIEHLEENVAAAAIELSGEQFERLDRAVDAGTGQGRD